MFGSEINYLEVLKGAFSDKKAASIGIILTIFISILTILGQSFVVLLPLTTILSLLFSVLFLGYGVKILHNRSLGDESLPGWEEIPDMIVVGLKSLVVWILYLTPILLVIVSLTLILFFGLISQFVTDPYAVGSTGYFGLWFLMCILMFAFVFYFFTGALANFAKDYSIRASLEFEEIKSRVLTTRYFIPFLISFLLIIGLMLLLALFTFLFGSLMILPTLVSSIVFWAGFVVIHSVIGKAYN